MRKTCKNCAGRGKYVVRKLSGDYIAECELCTDVLAKQAAKEKEFEEKLKQILLKKQQDKYKYKSNYKSKYNSSNYTYKKSVLYPELNKDYYE